MKLNTSSTLPSLIAICVGALTLAIALDVAALPLFASIAAGLVLLTVGSDYTAPTYAGRQVTARRREAMPLAA